MCYYSHILKKYSVLSIHVILHVLKKHAILHVFDIFDYTSKNNWIIIFSNLDIRKLVINLAPTHHIKTSHQHITPTHHTQ